ncbi:radial spoke head [Stylonychia lemnae]|uniref:Radial spoke head protein 9 homolog n=1 Tax=Stylonychia lemnae TaxID=5949 RepID=A0A078AN29_STYLE|nr:radial spoke head [Stylonychia lemnae]|eukprot:CDW83569.1 radial spoke head [Stylonychia lemnae]
MGLLKLQANWRPEELQFWGKIQGINNDYYIAVSLTYTNQYEFPTKKFFWALSKDFEFQEMPELNDQHKEAINKENSLFEGNPKKKLVSVKKEGEEEEGGAPAEDAPVEEGGEEAKKDNLSDISEEEEIKIPPKDLTELDRLTYVVHAIENDCVISPIGAYKLTPTHQVRRNEAFKGLNEDQYLQLENYQHFRNVQGQQYKDELDKPSAPFNPRFLEPVVEDQPKGVWSIQADSCKTNAIARNLLWPGFGFYHKHGSKKFGNMYIGDGLKNDELPFMIQ